MQNHVLQRIVDHPGRGGCGVGAIADLGGPCRAIVDQALMGLGRMEHRGGCVDGTGDGAGLLLRTPRAFFEPFLAPGRHLKAEDHLSVGVVFFPHGEPTNLPPTQQAIDQVLRRQGLAPLGWRKVPVRERLLSPAAHHARKEIWQVLVGQGMVPRADLPMALFRAKTRIEHGFRDLYVASLSPHTLVYKAMVTGSELPAFYPDLEDPALTTDLCVFHRRYSTNTFSNWYLAQPFRVLGHNGEINTIKAARSAIQSLQAELGLPGLLMHQGSDSADLDRMVELLVSHGVPLLEALVRILPAAWKDRPETPRQMVVWQDAVRRAMGTLAAWEGPAAVVATDGVQLVGILDRMGLRPLRYLVTHGRRVVLASEMGAIPVDAADIARTGQLDPGEAVAVDLQEGRILLPEDVGEAVLAHTRLNMQALSAERLHPVPVLSGVRGEPWPERGRRLALFGWDTGRVKAVEHMAREGKEPLSAMGHDRPLAVFNPGRPPLTKYFRQIIAVVTNPPIDPIREGGAMDLSVYLGRAPDVSEHLPEYRVNPQYRLERPFLGEAELHAILAGGPDRPRAMSLDATYPFPESGDGNPRALASRITEVVAEAVRCVRNDQADVLVLSDRAAFEGLAADRPPTRLPLPMVLLVSALHEALTEVGLRREASIVVDTGEVQEGHDAAVLIACGASAVSPWLFLEVCKAARVEAGVDPEENGLAALGQAVRRILSKMGTTTLDGYRGSRLFEAVGVSPALVDYYLPGITSHLGGVDLEDLHQDALHRARAAADPALRTAPRPKDTSAYRKEVWHQLQRAARGEDPEAYGAFVSLVEGTPPVYLRDLLELHQPADDAFGPRRHALDETEVAPAEWIVATTFRGAAMSHGALHRIAHRAIAGAFNRFGSRSNSGEGGEDARRNRGGEWEADRSRIRQVASGRFGVDADYLVSADEIEIKIGQGAKPGEGGHLPGHKVTAEIARIRRAREGATLISPPPHHDIYSIEDLAQLVYDLRQLHPRATLGVKCPTVTDIGTIAVGVVKAGADVITLSGAEGGTGAAAASSIEHAGLPLERGLAEAHQALVVNGLREQVVLRADGGIKTGGDVVKILALGADEVALGTALMIAEQCVFCHGCAKGDCPAGITTQREDVAQRLMRPKGAEARRATATPVSALAVIDDPEADEAGRYREAQQAVANYLLALADDVRRHLARVGLRSPAQLVGRVDLLRQRNTGDARADRLDLSELLLDPSGFPAPPTSAARGVCGVPGDGAAPSAANRRLVEAVHEQVGEIAAGKRIGPVEVVLPVDSQERALGATLAGELASGRLGAPPAGIEVRLTGSAGQALGFGLVPGVTLDLTGYANDSVGEAMSGGRIVVRRPAEVPRGPGHPVGSAAGNAVGYGMTGGELFIEGRCGQRLGVRQSDGVIVCEGAGKYAFEYMTGGTGVVLGTVGGQVASGLTGGTVFLWNPEGVSAGRVNADAKVGPLTEANEPALRELVARHAEVTGSVRARDLLADWERARGAFVEVGPAVG